VRRALALLNRHPGRLITVLALTLVAGLFEGIGLLLLVPLLAIVGIDVPVDGPVGSVASAVVATFDALSIPVTLAAVLVAYVAIVALQSGFRYLEQVRTTALVEDLKAELRQDVFAAIARAGWPYHLRRRGSDLLQVLNEEVFRAGDVASHGLAIVTMGATALVYLGVALYLSPLASGVAVATAALLLLVLRTRSARSRAAGEAWSEASEGVYFAASEFLSGLKTAKSHASEERHIRAFGRETRRLADSWVDSARSYADVQFFFTVGAVVVLSALVWAALDLFQLEAAALLVLIYIFVRLIPRFSALQRSAQYLANALPGLDRVEAVLDEAGAASEATGTATATRPPALQSGVRLESVEFDYEAGDPMAGTHSVAVAPARSTADDDRPFALRGVSLGIPAGETTALVGVSGSGKTTIADLVIGLLQPTSGRITVDGVDLADRELPQWRSTLGYVPQESFLFNDTIRANLVPGPGIDDDALMAALASARLDTFVQGLPHGLDTVVGERGVRLSGGERQRLALARALVRRPALLILDEATSALDAENETLIHDALERLHGDLTVLVITHRLAFARGADRIHVLEGGRLVQSGRWDDLIAAEGRFRELATAAGAVG
jgi:ATP-binding cassette subfamily C protein